MVELAVRLVFSLAVVIGLLLMLMKLSAKKFRGSADALVTVVHRQALSRTSSVAVVTVGSRVLVLGTTEQNVQLLTELDPEEMDLALDEPGSDLSAHHSSDVGTDSVVHDLELTPRRRQLAGAHRATPIRDGALTGSVLSAQTWKQALAVATGKVRDAS